MLDISRLRDQFPDFSSYQMHEQALLAGKLKRALDAITDCAGDWKELRDQVEAVRPKWLVAGLRSSPAGVATCGPRPTPISVVATDGSQIYPDRHVEPTCYLLNVSRIAFHYGTVEQPLMESVPFFRYRRPEVEETEDPLLGGATPEVVSALRDEAELKALLAVAMAVRKSERPLVALADGTLIRWMIRLMQNPDLEARLITSYTNTLSRFREKKIPLCAYISMPGNMEVVNLLRVYLGETDDDESDSETSLAGLTDRLIFERVLSPGERSATFETASHIQREYGVDRICYFYVHIPSQSGGAEIGRVEIPHWIADDNRLVDLIHAVVLSECEKGDGYPMILSEAHEKVVIRAQEKEHFYELIAREMAILGVLFSASRKQVSKRRPLV